VKLTGSEAAAEELLTSGKTRWSLMEYFESRTIRRGEISPRDPHAEHCHSAPGVAPNLTVD
jgi:hypothetical protein